MLTKAYPGIDLGKLTPYQTSALLSIFPDRGGSITFDSYEDYQRWQTTRKQ